MDNDKLTPVPDDFAKLSNVVNNIDTTGFVLKTAYDTDKSDLEKKISDADKKIPDVSGLVKKTIFNSKITEIEGKMPSITGLASNSELTAAENKIPDVSGLVEKTEKIEKKRLKNIRY